MLYNNVNLIYISFWILHFFYLNAQNNSQYMFGRDRKMALNVMNKQKGFLLVKLITAAFNSWPLPVSRNTGMTEMPKSRNAPVLPKWLWLVWKSRNARVVEWMMIIYQAFRFFDLVKTRLKPLIGVETQ